MFFFGVICIYIYDWKESGRISVIVLEIVFDMFRIIELYIMDDYFRDEVIVFFIICSGKAVIGDDGFCGRDV